MTVCRQIRTARPKPFGTARRGSLKWRHGQTSSIRYYAARVAGHHIHRRHRPGVRDTQHGRVSAQRAHYHGRKRHDRGNIRSAGRSGQTPRPGHPLPYRRPGSRGAGLRRRRQCGLNVFADGNYISIAATGFTRDIPGLGAGLNNFLFCDVRGNRDLGGGNSAARTITVAPTGRPQVYRDVARVAATLGGCP